MKIINRDTTNWYSIHILGDTYLVNCSDRWHKPDCIISKRITIFVVVIVIVFIIVVMIVVVVVVTVISQLPCAGLWMGVPQTLSGCRPQSKTWILYHEKTVVHNSRPLAARHADVILAHALEAPARVGAVSGHDVMAASHEWWLHARGAEVQ